MSPCITLARAAAKAMSLSPRCRSASSYPSSLDELPPLGDGKGGGISCARPPPNGGATDIAPGGGIIGGPGDGGGPRDAEREAGTTEGPHGGADRVRLDGPGALALAVEGSPAGAAEAGACPEPPVSTGGVGAGGIGGVTGGSGGAGLLGGGGGEGGGARGGGRGGGCSTDATWTDLGGGQGGACAADAGCLGGSEGETGSGSRGSTGSVGGLAYCGLV